MSKRTRPNVPTVTLIYPTSDYAEYQITQALKICIDLGRGTLVLTEKGRA